MGSFGQRKDRVVLPRLWLLIKLRSPLLEVCLFETGTRCNDRRFDLPKSRSGIQLTGVESNDFVGL